MPKKSDYWLITSVEKIVSKVSFEEEVTEEEAIEAFEAGDFYDITDEMKVEILNIEKAEPIGDETEEDIEVDMDED